MSAYRLKSIDLLRGVVMIIMAIDHTRDFFHYDNFLHNPLDLVNTSPALYFTRWITHFCAPVFVFLAGTSSFLQSFRKSRAELSRFLLSRGLWLIFVEFFIMSFAFTFDVNYGLIVMQVIWSIGISLVIMAGMIWLPFNAILVTGFVIVFGHNILDYAEAHHEGPFGFFWDLAHHGNFGGYGIGTHRLAILYPFAAWTGLMMLGYCAGKLFQPAVDAPYRKKILIRTGLSLILFFIILRAIRLYGDPVAWFGQSTALFTFFSFMNVTKYPPSLLYLCITIGPALLFLAFAEKTDNKLSRIVTVYGRVPFLYYILHFYILHTVTAVFFLSRGHTLAEGVAGTPNVPFKFVVPGEGLHLWQVYIVWFLTIAALFPVCKWFSDYKLNHKKWWLSYL
jgi:uncharacterized membrane protein